MDELSDLNQTSKKIIEINEKMAELEKNGQDLLFGLDDNDICTIKIKLRIKILLRDTRGAIDICVRENLIKQDILLLNVSKDTKLCIFVDLFNSK